MQKTASELLKEAGILNWWNVVSGRRVREMEKYLARKKNYLSKDPKVNPLDRLKASRSKLRDRYKSRLDENYDNPEWDELFDAKNRMEANMASAAARIAGQSENVNSVANHLPAAIAARNKARKQLAIGAGGVLGAGGAAFGAKKLFWPGGNDGGH